MRSASPLRAGLASAGGQKPQLGGCSGRALGCWAGRLAPSGPGPDGTSGDVGSRAAFFNGLAGGLEVFFLGLE